MTAISPLRGSFVSDYLSQRPFFLDLKKTFHLFVSLQYKSPSFFLSVSVFYFNIFFLASFCQMKFFFKMAKDKCFWGFLLA